MARILKGSQFYLHAPRASANGMNHTCLCLPSRSWSSFTDPGGMEGWVGLGTCIWSPCDRDLLTSRVNQFTIVLKLHQNCGPCDRDLLTSRVNQFTIVLKLHQNCGPSG